MEKEKEKQEQNEEHHIDKKQKTENQQDEVVKARRPRKLSRNNTLDPTKSVRYHLGFGIRELDIWLNPPVCIRSPPYVTLYGYEASRILLQDDLRKLRESKRSPKW